jgi:hypothetical protein
MPVWKPVNPSVVLMISKDRDTPKRFRVIYQMTCGTCCLAFVPNSYHFFSGRENPFRGAVAVAARRRFE